MRIALGANWFESESEEWVLPGLLCDSLTLISGEPKSGKTSLACHIVRALIENSEILGRLPNRPNSTVAWMGFDFQWDRELKDRLPDIYERIYFAEPLHWSKASEWNELMHTLRENGVSLLVIDHLYGLGAGEELDKQYQVQQVLSPINALCRQFGISVLLLTQASRTGTGRAAHSVAIEGMARWLIRIKGTTSKTRTLETVGNNAPTENIKIKLNPKEIFLVSSKDSEAPEKKRDNGLLPNRARFILRNAPSEVRYSPTKMGDWLASQGMGIKSSKAGRAAIYDLLACELLTRLTETEEITAGPKLVTELTAV